MCIQPTHCNSEIFLYIVWRLALIDCITTWRCMWEWSHIDISFLTLTLNRGEWSVLRLCRFSATERVPSIQWTQCSDGTRVSVDAMDKVVNTHLGLQRVRLSNTSVFTYQSTWHHILEVEVLIRILLNYEEWNFLFLDIIHSLAFV
jgi:hypothetical protein